MQSYDDALCLGWNDPLAQTGIFTEKVTTYLWSTYCPPLLHNIWRESLQRISRKLTFVKFHQPIMLN